MLTAKRAVLVAGAASVLLVGGGAAGAAIASGEGRLFVDALAVAAQR